MSEKELNSFDFTDSFLDNSPRRTQEKLSWLNLGFFSLLSFFDLFWNRVFVEDACVCVVVAVCVVVFVCGMV